MTRMVLGANAAAAVVTLAFSVVVLVEPGAGLPAGVDVTAGAGPAVCAFVIAVVPLGSLPFGSLWTARGIRDDGRSVDVGA